MKPNNNVLEQFKTSGNVIPLAGGEKKAYRVGEVVLKHINKDFEEYTNWIADLFNDIKEDGFRVPRPISTNNNKWITSDGWSAWTLLKGNHNYKNHVAKCIKAIIKFHEAIKDVPRPILLDKNDSVYARADRYAWENKPNYINPELERLVNSLYILRDPVKGLNYQLIHGDLNPDNILVAPKLPPAIIDIAPYWRPVEFALAVYAYWIGPWRNDLAVLKYFSNVKGFNQLLIRAAIRMLMIMSESKKVNELEKYTLATKLTKDWVTSH